MNVSRLIGGIVCLLIAGLLLLLYFVLPPDRMMFQVGDANVPWLPAIVLGILGIYLIVTAMGGSRDESEASAQAVEVDEARAQENAALNKHLESIGWGFFLVMAGGSLLIPNDVAPNGLWTIGVGLIMLGLNAARYFNGLKMSGFTTVLGSHRRRRRHRRTARLQPARRRPLAHHPRRLHPAEALLRPPSALRQGGGELATRYMLLSASRHQLHFDPRPPG